MIKSLYGKKPEYIQDSTWEALTDKERDYICLLAKRTHTKKQIMRRLYITSRQSYYLMERKVRKALASDVKKFYDNK